MSEAAEGKLFTQEGHGVPSDEQKEYMDTHEPRMVMRLWSVEEEEEGFGVLAAVQWSQVTMQELPLGLMSVVLMHALSTLTEQIRVVAMIMQQIERTGDQPGN